MSNDLKLDVDYLVDLSYKVDSKYRHVKVAGRWIDAPSIQLKLVQRWILDFISYESPRLPDFVTAYEPGSSIVENADKHSSNRHLAHLDIKGCFHSCPFDEVVEVLRSVPARDKKTGKPRSLKEDELVFLATLSTVKRSSDPFRHLCVGSPCSPMLANRILLPVDYKIISALGKGYTYSRYSDDICISSSDWIDIDHVVAVVSAALGAHGFELNDAKTRCMGPGDHRYITGVTITPDGKLSVGRRRKQQVERALYKYLVHGEGEAGHILGLINFCRSIDSAYVSRLLNKYSNYGAAATTPGGAMAVLEQGLSAAKETP